MTNTGYKGWTTLEQYNTSTGAATGLTKPNVPGDPDYVPPVQDVKMCPTNTLFVSPTSRTVASDGGLYIVSVESNASWQVTSNVFWIKPDRSSGTGNMVMEVFVNRNTTGGSRSGKLTYTSGGVTKTSMITQQSL